LKCATSAQKHAFIGKLKDGTNATYQTLPWNMRGWHGGGSSNNTHIGFEICEDGLSDPAYFSAIYKEAVELCVYLCKQYGMTEKDIICHCEGYKLGIASNHERKDRLCDCEAVHL
jgi:N-acetylmuramoyl-L-alanine amidase